MCVLKTIYRPFCINLGLFFNATIVDDVVKTFEEEQQHYSVVLVIHYDHFHLGFIPTNIINIYQIIMFKVTYPEDDSDKSLPSPSSSILINFKFCSLISRLLPARNTLIRCPYCVVHALSKLNAAGVFFPRWSRLEHSSLLPIKSCRPSVQTSYSTLERASTVKVVEAEQMEKIN